MPRFALCLVLSGLAAILLTVVLVMSEATLPGRLPLLGAAAMAGLGGLFLVLGLWMLEPGKPSVPHGPSLG
jgi:hypothetical protein